jgi:pimeloyl-ACP methyl ester carboxylesterase
LKGKNLIIFDGGILTSGVIFKNIQNELYEKHNIGSCYFDRPHYGYSSVPETSYHLNRNVKTYSKELNEIIKSELSSYNLILVGHSYGNLKNN